MCVKSNTISIFIRIGILSKLFTVPNKESGSQKLFGVVSGTFQPLLASHGLFGVVPFFTSNEVRECFDLQIYYESTGKGNRFWQLTPLFTQHVTPRNS